MLLSRSRFFLQGRGVHQICKVFHFTNKKTTDPIISNNCAFTCTSRYIQLQLLHPRRHIQSTTSAQNIEQNEESSFNVHEPNDIHKNARLATLKEFHHDSANVVEQKNRSGLNDNLSRDSDDNLSGEHTSHNIYPSLKQISNIQENYTTINHFIGKWEKILSPGEHQTDDICTIAGRVTAKREASSKLTFLSLEASNATVQVMASRKEYSSTHPTFEQITRVLARGDVLRVTGYPGKTRKGELSIIPKEITLIAPCLHNVPASWYGLKDKELRYRLRHLDFIMNPKVRHMVEMRHRMNKALREFLDEQDFIEVETPMMNTSYGGASAAPFTTHSHALNSDMFFRVAPELHLKRLIIGGLWRVYEIGKNFRNEGIDAMHSPEFSTCELYMAMADAQDLIPFTERLLQRVVSRATGGHQVSAFGQNIDFSGTYKRVDFMKGLEEATHMQFPHPTTLHTQEAAKSLESLAKELGVYVGEPRTPARVLDKIAAKFLEPTMIAPTFLHGHPIIMSPLAKENPHHPGLAERFELFVGGHELINAYTELNDPAEQRRRFLYQQEAKSAGDEEAQLYDEDYCQALEYGLPPTAGWGLGLDRLAMLLTNSDRIRDVQTFPLVKKVNRNS